MLVLFLSCCPIFTATELTVYAAASLADALAENAAAFQKERGAIIYCNFGASSALARQIEAGGRADLFISADEEKMDWLQRKDLILAHSRTNLLSNSLIVVVAGEVSGADWPGALLRFDRIALAEPATVPAGIYARKYLESAGVWATLKKKFIPTQSVRGALAAVESGNVDAAIVYKSDGHLLKTSKVAYEIPLAETPLITYPAAVTTESAHPELAAQFLRYLGSETAWEVWSRHGFTRVSTHAD